jgi:hypothetical protein
MKKKLTLTLTALGLTALASACTMEAAVEEGQLDVGTSEEALVCTNHQAVHSVMAALASAAMVELGRWAPEVTDGVTTKAGDFKFNSSTYEIELTAQGNARCAAWPYGAPKNCRSFKANLELFKWDHHGVVIGGAKLDVGVLKSRMASAFERQKTCMFRPNNGFNDDCPVEKHDLKFLSASNPASSCASVVKADAYKQDTVGAPFGNGFLTKPKQLANMLVWAGWGPGEYNPWIAFDSVGDTVSIDPLPGMTEGVPQPQANDQYLVSYCYNCGTNQTAQYGYVESLMGVDLKNMPCKADAEYCVTQINPITQQPMPCPTAVRYLQKRAFSATKYDCKNTAPIP